MSDGPRKIKVRFDGKEITIINPEAQVFRKGAKAIIWIRDPEKSEWTFSRLKVGVPIGSGCVNSISNVQVFEHRIAVENRNPGRPDGKKCFIPYEICVKSATGDEVCAGSASSSFDPPFQIENEPNGGVDASDPPERPSVDESGY